MILRAVKRNSSKNKQNVPDSLPKPDGSLVRPEVYLGETFINKNHSNQFTWYYEQDGPDVNKPAGKGERLIVVNAITLDGWVNNGQLVFEAKKRTYLK